LKRFQEDTREVRAGFECGIALERFSSFEEGDVIQAYRRQRVT
jgi:translation initiation factor IF-2